jgi:hypothetical protein
MRHASVVGFSAALFVLAALASGCAPALYSGGSSQTYMGFSIGVSNAPPPPRVYYRSEPRFLFVVSSGVRVVEPPDSDCDLFYFSGSYYLYRSGYWYRSRSYGGDYRVIEVRRVPRAVLDVPPRHWRNHPGRGHGRWKNAERGRGRD